LEQGKVCTKCGEFKIYAEFYKNKIYKDGYRGQCKECMKQGMKQYNQENKEQIAEYMKQYRQENREQISKRMKQYARENKEHISEYMKRYYQENKDQIAEYQQENKEKITEYMKQYRQSEQGREANYKAATKRRSYKMKVKFTTYQRKELLDRDNWTCQCCGIKVHDRSTGDWNTHDKANIDHIIPISRGGNSEPNNLQILCRTCNLSKSDKMELVIT
jgi:5-methylcytosine-specific restriction endonuclease McrA